MYLFFPCAFLPLNKLNDLRREIYLIFLLSIEAISPTVFSECPFICIGHTPRPERPSTAHLWHCFVLCPVQIVN